MHAYHPCRGDRLLLQRLYELANDSFPVPLLNSRRRPLGSLFVVCEGGLVSLFCVRGGGVVANARGVSPPLVEALCGGGRNSM